jgi:hypothetical protein
MLVRATIAKKTCKRDIDASLPGRWTLSCLVANTPFMSGETRSARADRSTVHAWDLAMPWEAEPYTLVQVTRRRVRLLGRAAGPPHPPGSMAFPGAAPQGPPSRTCRVPRHGLRSHPLGRDGLAMTVRGGGVPYSSRRRKCRRSWRGECGLDHKLSFCLSCLCPGNHHWPRRVRTPSTLAAAISVRSGIAAASAAASISAPGFGP